MSRRPIYIVGCGPGDPELITLKARRLIEEADVLLYTGSLLPQWVVELAKKARSKRDTSRMTESEIVETMVRSYEEGLLCVWAHDGDPTIYGGIARVIKELRRLGVPYEIVPGVSSITASAAVLGIPLTLPVYGHSILVTYPSGLREIAKMCRGLSGVSIVIVLTAGRVSEIVGILKEMGFDGSTPVGVVYRATQPSQIAEIVKLEDLPRYVEEKNIRSCLTIVVSRSVSIDELDVPPTRVYGDKR